MFIDRIDLRNLAEVRVRDAKVLLDHGQYDGAYYLAGYAVECALKSIIAGRTRRHEFPGLVAVKKAYTHNLEDLLVQSELKLPMYKEFTKDPVLRKNWQTVVEWSETSRYEAARLNKEAGDLYVAIADPTHGFLSCISKYW